MRYEGAVYRPPSEAYSLIIQITIGCSHNKCTFCSMYQGEWFRVRKKEDIFQDVDECSAYYGGKVRRIFLADGDALVVKTEDLLEIMEYMYEKFPLLERISSYTTAGDVLGKTEEELKLLAAAGLELVYIGAESGDDQVLAHICKGNTADEMAEAGQKLKRCGIKTSVTLISGLAGRKGLKEHAVKSAQLISRMNPEYASFMTLQLDEGTPMKAEVDRGEMEVLTPDEVVEEMELFLSHMDSPGTVFRTNHVSNYVVLAGTFNQDIPAMMEKLKNAKEHKQYRLESWRRKQH